MKFNTQLFAGALGFAVMTGCMDRAPEAPDEHSAPDTVRAPRASRSSRVVGRRSADPVVVSDDFAPLAKTLARIKSVRDRIDHIRPSTAHVSAFDDTTNNELNDIIGRFAERCVKPDSSHADYDDLLRRKAKLGQHVDDYIRMFCSRISTVRSGRETHVRHAQVRFGYDYEVALRGPVEGDLGDLRDDFFQWVWTCMYGCDNPPAESSLTPFAPQPRLTDEKHPTMAMAVNKLADQFRRDTFRDGCAAGVPVAEAKNRIMAQMARPQTDFVFWCRAISNPGDVIVTECAGDACAQIRKRDQEQRWLRADRPRAIR